MGDGSSCSWGLGGGLAESWQMERRYQRAKELTCCIRKKQSKIVEGIFVNYCCEGGQRRGYLSEVASLQLQVAPQRPQAHFFV